MGAEVLRLYCARRRGVVKQAKKNTLSALSGFPVKNAMTGLATGNREGKPAEREQQVYTPQPIIDVCLAVWPEGIALDPCSGPGSIVPAELTYSGRYVDSGRIGKNGPIMQWIGPGRHTQWVPRTYCNPPFVDAEEWMLWACSQPREHMLLVPVRTNRKWWHKYRATNDAIAWLWPFPFHEETQALPVPLGLHYVGERVEEFKHAVELRKLGKVDVL